VLGKLDSGENQSNISINRRYEMDALGRDNLNVDSNKLKCFGDNETGINDVP